MITIEKKVLIAIVVVALVAAAGCAALAGNDSESTPASGSSNQSGADSTGSLKSTPTKTATASPTTTEAKASTTSSVGTKTATRTVMNTRSMTVTQMTTATRMVRSTQTRTQTPTQTTTATSTSRGAPELSVGTKDATTTPGGNTEVQVTLTNDGSSTASDVGAQIRYEEFPDGWKTVGISNGDGDWNDSGGWSVSTLESEQMKSGSFTLHVSENTSPGQYEFPIQAIDSEGDVVDQTTETITIEQGDTSTPTSTSTETQTTVDREDMQVVKVKSLQRGSSSYEMVASGPITIGSETGSSAQVNGKKASGTVGNFNVDTYLIPQGEEVTAIRNTGYKVISATVDGENIEVEDGPDVDVSNFRSNSTITIKAGGGRSSYDIFVTGNFFATDETDDSSDAVYPDKFSDGNAEGSVADGGTDAYKFTGRLRSFFNYGDTTLKVFIDGKQVATIEPDEFYEADNSS